jgi:hypothetical protein
MTVLLVGMDMGYLARIAGRLSREGLATALNKQQISLLLCDLRNPGDLAPWVPGFAEYAGPLLFLSQLRLTDENFGGLEPVEVFSRPLDLDALVERVRQLEGA